MNQTQFIRRTASVLKDNRTERRVSGKRSGPWIDMCRLAGVAAGNYRVFMRKEERLHREYHVSVVVDVSGSMNNALQATACTAHALWWALGQLGCSLRTYAFADNVKELPEAQVSSTQRLYNAMTHADVGGGTNDVFAVKRVIEELKGRKGGKMVLVVTDGDGSGPTHMHPVLKEASEQHGVQVLALGIGDNREAVLATYGPMRARIVDDLDDMYHHAAHLIAKQYKRGV